MAGEYALSLHSALDYLTFVIFEAGGGVEGSADARWVAFPIAPDGQQWRKDKKEKLPTAWPEAVDCIKDFQPHFRRSDPDRELLPSLVAITARDKHRKLHLV